jgi:hypothetical protein
VKGFRETPNLPRDAGQQESTGEAMRVSIEHSQATTGLFLKTNHHVVSVTVIFSEEEKHVLKRHGDAIVVERGPDSERQGKFTAAQVADLGDAFSLKISTLLRGKADRYTFSTPGEAKEYDELVRGSLQNLKNYITNNSVAPTGTETFEL